MGKCEVLILSVRLASLRKTPQEADQFSGSGGGQGGACCREKRSSGVHPWNPEDSRSRSGCPYPGQWEMGRWERLPQASHLCPYVSTDYGMGGVSSL